MKKQDNKPKIDTLGKVPPQAIDVEMAILGTFILEPDSYSMNPISPELFYKDSHIKICEVIREMSKQGRAVDLLTVTQRLRETAILEEVGGPMYVTELCSMIVGGAHLSRHILILRDKHMRRELIRMSHELVNGSFDENTDLQDVVESAQSIFMKLLGDDDASIKSFDDVSIEIVDKMAENANDNIDSTGIPTGFKKFDEFAYGFQPSDLVIIGGESSHGKTTLAINIAKNAAKQGYPVAFYSMEMTSMQLISRVLAIESGISSKKILFQKLYREELMHVENNITKLSGLPIYIDDKSTSSVNKICASIRKMVLKYEVKEVVIDYLQLVSGDKSQGREEEVGQNARIFKNLAKELNIVIIALSQLSRAEDHIPSMKRLRSSGQIGEAADVVMLVWIPEVEGIIFLKKGDGSEINMIGKADIIIGKGRNVGTMNFTVNCNREINKMWDEYDSSIYQENIIESDPTDKF